MMMNKERDRYFRKTNRQSAEIIARAGYNIQQKRSPPLGSRKRPDYLIEGQI
jgi:hypothetical protein